MRPPCRKLLRALFAASLALSAGRASADSTQAPFTIPESEVVDPPTPSRLQAIQDYAAESGWNTAVAPIRRAAVRAYEEDRFVAAESWFHAYRWAALFSEPENVFINRWIDAITARHLNYEGVAGEYHPSDEPMGRLLTPQFQGWLLSNEAFSEEFFSNLKPVDDLPNVFAILERLHSRNADAFERYPSLALAIALVYDVPPPPYWPHQQVTLNSLPRRLPKPEDAFERLTKDDMEGRTYEKLGRLRVEELKFVVDTAASAAELAWSQANVPFTMDQFEGVYFMINYRKDRAASQSLMTWSGIPYTLQSIKAQGGICVDQAYFATEVGKARGIPTLLFTGSGQDGRHAWFGYLGPGRKWHLDAARYAEERLLTGNALDPQTWEPISDHELQFLSEQFRALPSFAQSRVQEEFAVDFLMAGDVGAAALAARKAVNYERRNLDAWETLIAANAARGLDAPKQEAVLREAALAFSPRYPDLVVGYVNRVCQSLRARGETSLADFEERGLADRLKGDRADLAIRQATAILFRSLATQPVQEQIATYNAILAQYGHGAGTMFFDQIVTAFAEHLVGLNMKAQAREAVQRAREALDVQPGTQFSMDVDKLLYRLQD